ncbi:hypothetical protein E1B28_007029 [Marasmius oreades]|uniref:Uncharacterized protein n=1 Tax=Marasmius oreades TaxID=181124 RepID=A0A9P7UTC7_9AGAR|nr:uncharacterized protein E1B28_007029 [Marasmius oreades]KAG7093348.1 hypothetical protein E1B28_007029 [Marasmius oreades]
MERSKTAPLDLEFFEFDEGTFERVEDGLLCLMDHSNRWRSLKLRGYDHPHITLPPAFRQLRGHLSNLQHFLLHYSWRNADMVSFTSDLDILSECPLLTSIELKIQNPLFNPHFPWSQIQSLKLAHCGLSQVRRTLASCNNLKRLELSYFLSGPITTLDQLRCLSVERLLDDEFFHFFQSYNLPSLSHLKIRDGCLDLHFLETFLNCSSCSITSLNLGLLRLSDVDLLHLLTLVPNLTTFSYEEYSEPMLRSEGRPMNQVVTTTFLQQLVLDSGDEHSTRFLPQLEDLTLTIYPLENSGRQALQHMLASRSTGQLRKFTLAVREVEKQVSDYESLQCFRDVGIQIHLWLT